MQPSTCTIKHRRYYRTRVKFPCLRYRNDLQVLLQEKLRRLPKVVRADIRCNTGSIILEHPDGPVSIAAVQRLVAESVVNRKHRVSSPPSAGSACPCHSVSNRKNGRKNHVPTPVLFLSGLYILYLFAKNLLTRSLSIATLPPSLPCLPLSPLLYPCLFNGRLWRI